MYLPALSKIVGDILYYYYYYFNTRLDISCESSAEQTILMKPLALYSMKSSAVAVHSAL